MSPGSGRAKADEESQFYYHQHDRERDPSKRDHQPDLIVKEIASCDWRHG